MNCDAVVCADATARRNQPVRGVANSAKREIW